MIEPIFGDLHTLFKKLQYWWNGKIEKKIAYLNYAVND